MNGSNKCTAAEKAAEQAAARHGYGERLTPLRWLCCWVDVASNLLSLAVQVCPRKLWLTDLRNCWRLRGESRQWYAFIGEPVPNLKEAVILQWSCVWPFKLLAHRQNPSRPTSSGCGSPRG